MRKVFSERIQKVERPSNQSEYFQFSAMLVANYILQNRNIRGIHPFMPSLSKAAQGAVMELHL